MPEARPPLARPCHAEKGACSTSSTVSKPAAARGRLLTPLLLVFSASPPSRSPLDAVAPPIPSAPRSISTLAGFALHPRLLAGFAVFALLHCDALHAPDGTSRWRVTCHPAASCRSGETAVMFSFRAGQPQSRSQSHFGSGKQSPAASVGDANHPLLSATTTLSSAHGEPFPSCPPPPQYNPL